MKTFIRLWLFLSIVIPRSVSAQEPVLNCHAGFKASKTTTCSSFLEVRFSDQSVVMSDDAIVAWLWSFGDGKTSAEKKPVHLYEKPGNYTVSLRIKTRNGLEYSSSQQNYIRVKGEVYVDLGQDRPIGREKFVDLDAQNPGSKYSWNTGANSQKIRVVAAGKYKVSVSKGNCQSRDSVNIFATSSLPYVDFSADKTYSCNGNLRVFFNEVTNFEPGDFIAHYQWDFGDGGTSNDSRPSHDYEKPGRYTVRLITYTHFGRTDTVTKENMIFLEGVVWANLGPAVSICPGESVEIDAGNPGATYDWTNGAHTQKVTFTQPNEYWVYIRKDGCESVGKILIQEKPPVTAQFAYQKLSTCLPMNVQFSDSSSWCGNNTITKWEWDFGDGSSSSDQNPNHFFTRADTFIVRLTIWDASGFSITRSKRVVIDPVAGSGPVVNLGNDTTVCEVDGLVLDAGNPGSSFTWSTGDFYQTAVITNTGQVWVRVESQDGCSASDTIQVTIRPSLVPKFGFSIGGQCLPVNVSFRDSSTTCGVEIVQWRWDFGDGTTSTEQHPVHAYTQNGEYIAQLTIFDNIGNSITRSKRVVINGISVPVNLGKDTTICFGDFLILDAGNPGAVYQWNTGETSQQIFVMDDGSYYVTVSQNGCSGTDTIRVTTAVPVTAGFDFISTGNCVPIKVNFFDKSTPGCGQQIVQWRWDFGDGSSSQEQNPLHVYQAPDTFAVRLTVTTNTGITVSRSRKVVVAQSETCEVQPLKTSPVIGAVSWLKDVKIKCSPNPNNGTMYLMLSRLPEAPLKATVIDRYGQRLYTVNVTSLNTLFNLNRLAKGYYTIELLSGKERKAIPILIQ